MLSGDVTCFIDNEQVNCKTWEKSMKRTLKQRQQICEDLFDACQVDPTLLDIVCDEYVYKLNETELDELEETIFHSTQHIYGGTEE